MIPTMTASATPLTSGKMVFHVIVGNFHHTFSLDGPGGPNGIRLHHKMLLSRAQNNNFRDFHIRADSPGAALAEGGIPLIWPDKSCDFSIHPLKPLLIVHKSRSEEGYNR
jgi:hypothetical protein